MSPERHADDRSSRPERRDELSAYHLASRFSDEVSAGRAYQQAQEALFATPASDLSVYRLILDEVSHLAVLGRTPPPDLAQTLNDILASGEPVELPPLILQTLRERRRLAIRRGRWAEGHYRPGRRPRRGEWP